MSLRWLTATILCVAARAQTICPATPRYTPCDVAFDVPGVKPDQPLDLHVEFRSPRSRTAMMNAFWDGGDRWIVRYTPTEAGNYDFRVTSSLPAYNGKTGTFTATPNDHAGWVRSANLHHFAYVHEITLTQHLWMGATISGFPSMSFEAWKSLVDTRSGQHFNHLAVTLVDQSNAASWNSPDLFKVAEQKIRYANSHGIVVDIAFFGPDNLGGKLLAERTVRAHWLENAISRLAAFDVTWQGVEAWESYENGREFLKEIGEAINQFDPYKHTRSSRSMLSSAPLVDDGWLRFRSYLTTNPALQSVDQQEFLYPAVNNFSSDPASFRKDLWTATMSGQYPSPVITNEAEAKEMKVWYEFMSATRHWELEPFFDVDNGKALAYEGIEYVIYLEKPQPVTVNLEREKYDIEWVNPANGESLKLKDQRTEVFTDSPPDNAHDWILHISREGKKASMLRSYKFDSREEQPLELQVIESNPEKVPFDIELPGTDTLSLAKPIPFRVKLKRETKATKRMLFVWTGEVTVDGQSFRVIGTGTDGTLTIPSGIARNYPAALHVKVAGLNGLGKLYTVDRNYTLTK